MNMASELVDPQHVSRYTLIDIRSLDSEPLLQSPWIANNILASDPFARSKSGGEAASCSNRYTGARSEESCHRTISHLGGSA